MAEGQGEPFPETVLALVQSRLSTLPLDARQVLRAASVFGRSFCKEETIRRRTTMLRNFDELVAMPGRDGGLAGGGRGGRAQGIEVRLCGRIHRGEASERCAWGTRYGGAELDVGSFRRAPLRRRKARRPSRVRRVRTLLVASAGVQAARGRRMAGS